MLHKTFIHDLGRRYSMWDVRPVGNCIIFTRQAKHIKRFDADYLFHICQPGLATNYIHLHDRHICECVMKVEDCCPGCYTPFPKNVKILFQLFKAGR